MKALSLSLFLGLTSSSLLMAEGSQKIFCTPSTAGQFESVELTFENDTDTIMVNLNGPFPEFSTRLKNVLRSFPENTIHSFRLGFVSNCYLTSKNLDDLNFRIGCLERPAISATGPDGKSLVFDSKNARYKYTIFRIFKNDSKEPGEHIIEVKVGSTPDNAALLHLTANCVLQ
jgi:hypothetical protein